ncbi:cytochrome P450 [Massilia sp. MB5]|uniref:cytochrome P450 n=1 Tax=unclassified Massilia TaxID=2609279 RepID=UPI00067DF3D1|nr:MULTISPECIES: cytochrome P450 [unclassified Massilia]UMR29385.1 cytochrome P450 [Massilia sp. MB5]
MSDTSTLAITPETEQPARLKYSRTIADLPGPKPSPFFGNLLQLDRKRIHVTVENWIRQFGPIFRFKILNHNVVVVSDYAVVSSLLRERPAGFRRHQAGVTIMKELKIDGVFGAEGEAWRRQRKLVMRGMNAEVVRNFFPTMVSMTERLMLRWKTALEAGKPVNVHRDLKAMSLDVIVALAMGFDLNAMDTDGNQLQRDIDGLFMRLGQRMNAIFPHWRHVRLPRDRDADASAGRIEFAVTEFIQKTRERIKNNPHLRQKPGNMLEAMIVASEEDGNDFTDQELIGNAITAVLGGEDTTANSIAWLINNLVQNPAAAAKLAAEADAVLGENRFIQDWEMLSELAYLDASHNESQRLKSVAPVFGLVSNEDCVVADTFFPKNTVVFASAVGASFDENHFPQSSQFLPERWIFDEKPEEGNDPNRKLFPFGGGTRLCPGRFLALTEIRMVIAMLMRNFELEPDPKALPVREVMNFFMVPSGVPVRLKLRT